MKALAVVLMLMCLSVSALAQDVVLPAQSVAERGVLVKTVTNFTAASDDTSGYISLLPNLGMYREVVVYAIASDSIQAQIQILGQNTKNTTYTQVAIDSISVVGGGAVAWSASVPKCKGITVKGGNANLIPGCDRFKIGVVCGAASAIGTTTGRTLKLYVWYVK